MRIDNNTNSLIRDLEVLQRDYKELRESLDFSQAKEKITQIAALEKKTGRSWTIHKKGE